MADERRPDACWKCGSNKLREIDTGDWSCDECDMVTEPKRNARTDMSETATCDKCDAEVVKSGWFWILPSEVGKKMATFCPGGGSHEVADLHDEDED